MVVQELADRLRANLTDRALAPDGRLPPERDLARTFGVSRGTLRKALLSLEHEGRISRHVGRGTFTSEAPHLPGDRLGDLISVTSPAEVMEVRLVLEPRIAALAALRATPADLRAMDACAAGGARASGVVAFEHWDSRLHRLIAASARNAMLLGLFDAVNAARQGELWGRLKAASLTPERHRTYARQHRRVIGAIRDRDAEGAARRMDEHLTTVRRQLLK